MKVIDILISIFLTFIFNSSWSQNKWINFTNANNVNCINIYKNHLWAGTEGGVIKWDLKTGSYQKFTTAEGLAHNNIVSIAIDSSGNKWFGTNGYGVSKFDGTIWTTFSKENGLSDNYISTIIVDTKGNIWFGTNNNGVTKYNDTEWSYYTESSGLADYCIYSSAVDPEGNIWFGTYSGVSKFDGTRWITYTTDDGLIENRVYAIDFDSKGNIWFGTNMGVSMFNGENWINYTTLDGLVNSKVHAILVDCQDNVWFGTSGNLSFNPDGTYRKPVGVSKFDGNEWITYSPKDGLSGSSIFSLDKDSEGNIWFGTKGDIIMGGPSSGGVSKFNGKKWFQFTTKDELASNNISNIFINNKNNKWFCTLGGLQKYDGENWTLYKQVYIGDAQDGRFSFLRGLKTIAVDTKGNIWYSESDKIIKTDGKTGIAYTTKEGLLFNKTNSIVTDSDDNVWIGTDNGIYKFNGKDWIRYSHNDGLLSNNVLTITIDNEGNRWFGTDRGVSKFDEITWTNYTVSDGLVDDNVLSIAIDPSGNKWFGTEKGVSEFDDFTWKSYKMADGLIDDYVSAIAIDFQGNKWFGTEKGVSMFDGENWVAYTVKNKLTDNNVNSISVDHDGNLWFATNNGISFYGNPETLRENNPDNYILFQNYPNPFNDKTTIKYQILKSTVVRISIYNLIGQNIKTLVNEYKRPGIYTVQWDGTNYQGIKVSSGMYVYSMHLNDFVKSNKMVYLK